MLVNILVPIMMPSVDSTARASSVSAATLQNDGGLIFEDQMEDQSNLWSSQQIQIVHPSTASAILPAEVEHDDSLFAADGSHPFIVYKKNDIRSFLLVAYMDPNATAADLEFSVSEDGAAYTALGPQVTHESGRDGSWDRVVYEFHGLENAHYLRVSWSGSPAAVYLSKIRIGYTGGIQLADSGFEATLASDLSLPGGWETRFAKANAGDTPDLDIIVETEGGAPGGYVKLTDRTASSQGLVFIGQKVRLPDFFTGPDDLVVTADYQLYNSEASHANSMRLVIVPVSEWDSLASSASGAGVYSSSGELYSHLFHDGSVQTEPVSEWMHVSSEDQDITAALSTHTGEDVVFALVFDAATDDQDTLLIDNFEVNLGELSNSRPHFINVKAVRDRVFGYRWAEDVVRNYQNRYDAWLNRDIELIPDSDYIWENQFNDPTYNVALIFEYKSYQDILALGYDYKTYHQVAEFKSPGLDPTDPSDDYIVSRQNTTPEQMEKITKGWFAKWIQYQTDAAEYLSYLYLLTGDQVYAAKSAEIVKAFSDKYPQYQIHDVVTPPRDFATRVFYSPLSEGAYFVIPLIYAIDNLYDSGAFTATDKKAIREGMIYPATDTLKFGLRMTNFQVVQDTAIGLAGYLYDDADLIADALTGYEATKQSGTALGMFNGLLDLGVGEDGFWFEGSPSYHSLVLKHYIFLADAAQRFGSNKGTNLYQENAQFKSMFDALLKLPYPDLTLQANNDSNYKPDLLTPTYLWMMETADREYQQLDTKYREYLNQAYQTQSRSAALMYSLLNGYAVIPATSEPFQLQDANMTGLGTAMSRSHVDGETYMTTLDYGPFAGGHDHYDKLNVTTYGNGRVWLDDLGISPYGTVSAEQYYRMSAAHNTVVVPDTNQSGIGGAFLALGSTRSMHYSASSADGIYPDVQQYRRALMTIDNWILDVFTLNTYDSVSFDWFAHVPDSSMELSLPTVPENASMGTSAGYQFTEVLAKGSTSGDWQADFTDTRDSQKKYRITMVNDAPMEVFNARSFGKGNEPNNKIPVLAARQTVNGKGEFVALHEFAPGGSEGVAEVSRRTDGIEVTLNNGTRYDVQYDISHAAEDANFKLLKRSTDGKLAGIEVAGDNRMTVSRTVYAKSDQILSGLSVVFEPNGLVAIDNDTNDETQTMMTNFTFFAGDTIVDEVKVDGVSVDFGKSGDYITIRAPLKAKPILQNRQFTLNVSEDAYAKEAEPNRVLGTYTTLGARNYSSANVDMAAYLKFDLGTYTGNQAAQSILRFNAYDNASPYNPIELSVYGITDNSWTENTLTWNNAPNLGDNNAGNTEIRGLGTTAFYIDTVSMDNHNYSWFEVDVSDFVARHGLDNGQVSFIIYPEDQGYNDWIFINSKESGTKAPQLVIRESEDLTAAESSYVRGGAYANQSWDGSSKMEVMDAPTADEDRIAYVKFDLSEYSADKLGKGILSFRAVAPGAADSVALTVYGIENNNWTESGLTWTNSSNHAAEDTTVTQMAYPATPIATIYVDDTQRTYAVDATAFLQSRLSQNIASFMLVDAQDGNVIVEVEGRMSIEPPRLSMYRPISQTVKESTFIWGGANADNNYEYSTHLIVKNADGTGADRKSYLKIDLTGIKTEHVNRAMLKLYGKNTTSTAATPVRIYGILDNDWSAGAITFNQAPNHDPISGNVTGIGTSAFLLDTIDVDGDPGVYVWDISDFLYAALKNSDSEISLVMVAEEGYQTSYLDFNSNNGIIKPAFELEY